ncbi:Symplekin tight junction protein C terminal-domain-containing protein [Gloeopeniophorella convolvens]|nr:Symplekin tight junction protein C terminal-domain-containing protein [Gloeopeniophorella convolvens]
MDPLQALTAALSVPADSKEQADLLATLRETLEAQPHPIPILCSTLLKTAAGSADSLLKRWVLDLLHFGIARAPLAVEARTQLAVQSLDVLAGLLGDASAWTVKLAVQTFAGAYPLLFRSLCTNRNARPQWDTVTRAKNRIIELVWAPGTPAGVQFAAVKFLQKVILVQSRGVADPRLQNKNDPNLAMVPGDHPFLNAAALETEGVALLQRLITDLYTKQNPDLLSAILNSWSNLVKLRPGFVQIVVSSLTLWTPAPLQGLPHSTIKSVEKSVRILLTHISRSPAGTNFAREISEALAKQSQRMEQAASEERARKAAAAQAQAEARKRPPSTSAAPGEADAKRQKLEPDPTTDATALLAAFDFTSLPAALISELIVANLQVFSEEALQARVSAYRRPAPGIVAAPAPAAAAPVSAAALETVAAAEAAAEAAAKMPPTAPAADRAREQAMAQSAAAMQVDEPSTSSKVKEEPVDPLQMDLDEDIEYEPDKLNLELEPMQEDDEALAGAELDVKELLSLDFQVPPPSALNEAERATTIKSTVSRLWQSSGDLAVGPQTGGQDLWMLLLVRMITRVVDPENGKGKARADSEDKDVDAEMDEETVELYERQDRLRRVLCDYIMADFSGRIRLASTWMNEEWYNDQVRLSTDNDWRPNYDVWLNQIVAEYQTHLDGKDRMFARFLLDLPSVPSDVFTLLRDLCIEPERMQVGFQTLRDFVTQRPTLRGEGITILLELTTHPGHTKCCILTVKRCMGEFQMVDGMIREFAIQLLRRLQTPRPGDKPPVGDAAASGNENMEDGQLPPEDLLQTPYLRIAWSCRLRSPGGPACRTADFAAYGEMDISVQEAIQELITQLIRSLGPGHGKLLTLMRTFPPGAETLALRVLNIFTDHGRPTAQLVALVKGLIADRDLDARFLIPIIAEMDKADIVKHLPRIVSILSGTQEAKELVRSVFGSVVTTPPQTFGSVTSNLPRVRQSELLTPAELMVLLHDTEKEIGIKSAIEAIGICFSMTDVFRSEILAVVMQQILDEPVLPTLFMRTVILTGFVSTTLLSRLITKKIWTTPLLWEGFIRCAQIVAPASFLVLLQLPKEQLRELVVKQPSLRGPLREFVQKKGGNPARAAVYLEIIGENEPQVEAATPTPAPETPPPNVPPAAPATADPTPS